MSGERPVNALVRGAFYLLVVSIPFEFPDRSFSIEIPTITASLFLLATLLDPHACYGRRPPALVWFAIYLYAYAVSAVLNGGDHLATQLITADYGAQVVKQFLQILQVVLLLWPAYNLLTSRQLARRALIAFALACVTRALLPIIGIARTAHTQWGGGERVTALGQNANNSAMIVGAGLVALIALQYGMEPPLVRRRWLVWPAVALLAYSVVDTSSRGGLVALGAGLVVYTLGGAPTAWARVRNGVVTTLAMAALVVATYANPLMRERFSATLERGALAGRERIYPTLLEMFAERPAVGWGPVNNKYELGIRLDERIFRRRDAHNLILEVLTATGILGAVPFLLGLGVCARGAWRARHRAHGTLPLALLACVMTANMSGNWIAAKLLWLVLAYGLASATYPPAAPLSARLVAPRRYGRASGARG